MHRSLHFSVVVVKVVILYRCIRSGVIEEDSAAIVRAKSCLAASRQETVARKAARDLFARLVDVLSVTVPNHCEAFPPARNHSNTPFVACGAVRNAYRYQIFQHANLVSFATGQSQNSFITTTYRFEKPMLRSEESSNKLNEDFFLTFAVSTIYLYISNFLTQ